MGAMGLLSILILKTLAKICRRGVVIFLVNLGGRKDGIIIVVKVVIITIL